LIANNSDKESNSILAQVMNDERKTSKSRALEIEVPKKKSWDFPKVSCTYFQLYWKLNIRHINFSVLIQRTATPKPKENLLQVYFQNNLTSLTTLKFNFSIYHLCYKPITWTNFTLYQDCCSQHLKHLSWVYTLQAVHMIKKSIWTVYQAHQWQLML